MRSRTALSLGVIGALGVGVWSAISAGVDDPVPSTTTSTTTEVPASTTTTVASTTSTRAAWSTTTDTTAPGTAQSTETRKEEVRQILEDLWFRWLHAVYTEDHSRLDQVVATESLIADFNSAVSTVEFAREPQPGDLDVAIEQLVLDSPDCLVVHRVIDAGSLLLGENVSDGVDVLWPADGTWRIASGWSHPSDLWHNDCEGEREELP